MKPKYDKFLLSYAVAKRAKELLEDGNYLLEEEVREKNPIIEAINEIKADKITIHVTEKQDLDLKEEDDTLDLLYDSIKTPEVATPEETPEAIAEEPKEKETTKTKKSKDKKEPEPEETATESDNQSETATEVKEEVPEKTEEEK